MTVVTGYVPPEFGLKSGGVIELRSAAGATRWTGAADGGYGSNDAWQGGASAGGPVGTAAALRMAAGTPRSDRFLDPVHPDNLHNRGRAFSADTQLSLAPGAADLVSFTAAGGRADYDVPHGEEQEAAGQGQRQSHRTAVRACIVAAHLVGPDRLAALRLPPPLVRRARRERTGHAALRAVDPAADAQRHPGERHARPRHARAEGGLRDIGVAPARILPIRRDRPRRSPRGGPQRGSGGIRCIEPASVPLARARGITIGAEAALLNALDARYAYNFGNLFSGTHFGAPRTGQISLTFAFDSDS